MKNFTKLISICSVFLFAGCDSNDIDYVDAPTLPTPAPTTKVQVLHASPDAPAVNVYVDGGEILPAVDYKTGSGALEVDAATYNVRVEAIIPGGNADVVDADLDLATDVIYTVAAVGSVADATFEPLIISQPDVAITGGSARLFVLHGAEGAPEVDVYVTGPDTDLAPGIAPVGTFSYKQTIGPAEVPNGDYRIRVTAAGNQDAVVFDSGTFSVLGGYDWTITAVTNTAGGADPSAAPISLVVMDGSGSFELLDADTRTSLQVVHASPDAGLVDIVVDGNVVTQLDFPELTGFLDLAAGTYNVAVTAPGNASAAAIGPVDLDLAGGTHYSVLAVGKAMDMTIEPLILTDDPRRVATNAKVRIVHASPTAMNVDIYVTAVGAGIAAVDPTIPDVAFKANTGFIPLPAGDYDVTVTPTGTKNAAIGPATITISNSGIYTVIARDPLPGAMELGVISSDDSPFGP